MGNYLVCLVWGMLGGKGWGIDAWPVVGMVDGSSPPGECCQVLWSFPKYLL